MVASYLQNNCLWICVQSYLQWTKKCSHLYFWVKYSEYVVYVANILPTNSSSPSEHCISENIHCSRCRFVSGIIVCAWEFIIHWLTSQCINKKPLTINYNYGDQNEFLLLINFSFFFHHEIIQPLSKCAERNKAVLSNVVLKLLAAMNGELNNAPVSPSGVCSFDSLWSRAPRSLWVDEVGEFKVEPEQMSEVLEFKGTFILLLGFSVLFFLQSVLN